MIVKLNTVNDGSRNCDLRNAARHPVDISLTLRVGND